jgi:hypothetical protein
LFRHLVLKPWISIRRTVNIHESTKGRKRDLHRASQYPSCFSQAFSSFRLFVIRICSGTRQSIVGEETMLSRRLFYVLGVLVFGVAIVSGISPASSQEPRDDRPRETGPRDGGRREGDPREDRFREDGPRDQQGPRGRRGQFGGGFNIPFGPPGARPGGLLMLLAIPEVQKEITLDDEQRKEVEKLQTAQRDKMDAIFRDFPPGPPPGDEHEGRDRPRVDFRCKIE